MYFSCCMERVEIKPSILSNQLEYKRPWYLFNGHLETIIPYLRSKIYQVPYERERLELADGDFLDLDWIQNGNDNLLIITHAFEGNSRDYFVERSAKYFSTRGYDVLMWNFRSCSKELNRLPQLYSLNNSTDLHRVVTHGNLQSNYHKTFLLGFSLGAVTTLNYVASPAVSQHVTAAAVVSVPLDLQESLHKIESGLNHWIYGRNFFQKLRKKLIRKSEQFPEIWDMEHIKSCATLNELIALIQKIQQLENDHLTTISPIHQLDRVAVPTFIINAQNDPILGPSSYPTRTFRQIECSFPKFGGHTGFTVRSSDCSWIEPRVHYFFGGHE